MRMKTEGSEEAGIVYRRDGKPKAMSESQEVGCKNSKAGFPM